MANTVIQLKKSSTLGAVPPNLANGEIAINYADGKLYYKNVSGQIVEVVPSDKGNYFSTVNANGVLIVSDTTSDIFSILNGTNIQIVGDAINDTITISADLSPANSYATSIGASSNNWANTKLSNGTVTLAGALTTTGQIYANSQISIYPVGGDEGGELQLFGTGSYPDWSIDSYQDQLRFFTVNTGIQKINFFNAGGGSVKLGVNNGNPNYEIDVSGDVNVTGSFRVNGSPIVTGSVDLTPANNWANTIGTAGNNYTLSIGASSNDWVNTVSTAANTFANNTFFLKTGGTISGNVVITGSLNISGNAYTIDTETLRVGDPLIYLAGNNYTSDAVDIGFIGNYVNTGGANVHTGLYRSSLTKEYYLFEGYDKEPFNNYIDPTGNNLTAAILNTTIRTSNLILGGANAITTINNKLANTSGVTFAGDLNFPASSTVTVNGLIDIASSASGAILKIRDPSSGLTFLNQAGINYIQSGANTFVSGSSADLAFTDNYNANQWMIIKANTGNVGISNTAPGQKLVISYDTDNSAQIGRAHIGYVSYTDYAGFSHINMTNLGDYALLQSSTGATFLNASATQGIYFRNSNVTKMFLSSAGKLGIGTVSPSSNVHVIAGTDSECSVSVRSGRANSQAWLSFENSAGSEMGYIGFGALNNGRMYVWQDQAEPMYFGTNNTTRMVISKDGYVGVSGGVASTPNPAYAFELPGGGSQFALHISPSINADTGGYINSTGSAELMLSGGANYNSFSSPNFVMTAKHTAASGVHFWSGITRFWNNTGTTAGVTFNQSESMRIDSSGNVGIGTTTTSTYRLNVSAPTAGISVTTTSSTSGLPGLALFEGTMSAIFTTSTSANTVYIGSFSSNTVSFIAGNSTKMTLTPAGDFGIGTATPAYKLQVVGSFAATTKSFVIDHPTKPGMKLRHGSLEGPENGVYVRGKLDGTRVIELPDYWEGLVDLDTITVQLTAIGRSQNLYVTDIDGLKIHIDTENHTQPHCYYHVYGERKDVEKMIVEY